MSSLTSSLYLSLSLLVILFFSGTYARPQDVKETSSDWSNEWQQVADWWKPKTDKDKWRAFEPSKETSTSRWWEQKLDDDLWNPRTPSSLEKVPVSTAKPEVVTTGEMKMTSTSTETTTQVVTETITDASTTSAIKSNQSKFGQTFYRKAELNTFVEPEPGTYYRPNGVGYGEKSWDSSYTQLYEGNAANQQSTKARQIEAVLNGSNKDENSASSSGKSANTLPKAGIQFLDNRGSNSSGSVFDTALPVASSNKSSMAPEAEDEKQVQVKKASSSISGKGESIVQLSSTSTIPVTTKKAINDFVDWPDWDSSLFRHYDDDDDDDEENKDENKTSDSANSKSSSAATINVMSKSSSAGSSTSKSSSAGSSTSKSSSAGSSTSKSSSSSHSHMMMEEEEEEEEEDSDEYYDDWDDDYYDYDDDDDDDLLENEAHLEILEGLSPMKKKEKEKKKDKGKKLSWSPKIGKGLDIDPMAMAMQSDQAASHVDLSHYSKGIIYDSAYPNHKPSVKKDLTNPANQKKEEELKSSPSGDVWASKDHNGSTKKESSVTHFQPDHLNTESDASTSPNPAPPGAVGKKATEATLAFTTTPGASREEDKHAGAGAALVKDMQELVLSFPLEFCKVDFECRAGRMCVQGVCKCVPQAMCAGHHKPICGSDGLQYSSHCELHRSACTNRVHLRVDRSGRCLHKEIEKKEKSWLMAQERLLQEDRAKSNSLQIPSKELYQFPQDINTGVLTSDVKKSDMIKEEAKPAIEKNTPSSSAAASNPTAAATTAAKLSNKKDCSWREMEEFKEALLMYYCQKFVEPNCPLEVRTDREYLSMLMFSYYDEDFDYYLTSQELQDKERDEHFTKNIIINCHLQDFVKFADNLEADGQLTVSEFTNAFEVAASSSPPASQVTVIPTLTSAGNGLELKCGLDAVTVIWRRHGTQLTDDKHNHQLMVFDDGALFFSKVGLHHIGNYSCADADDESIIQVHRLRVQTLPVVHVSPVTQTQVSGSDVELKCYAEGVPQPTVTWKLGGEELPNSPHATHYYGGGHVVIHNAQFDADAGTYTCSAHNQAGTTEKSVSVSILLPTISVSKESSKKAGTFVVLHSKGISAYDPLRCLLRHKVNGDFGDFKFIPDALDGPMRLCRKEADCQWGGAVRVGRDFIYASQPDQNRLVVIDAGDTWTPLQVIETDQRPQKLWYVQHLDQVWVLCSSQGDATHSRTIVVIRDASQHIQHRSVHTRPVGNHFDTVQDLFIASPNDLEHEFDFAYVSHSGQNGLFKLNLEDMSYTKAIDLTNYGCVPVNIAFVPIGGHVIIQCVSAADHHTLQLTMDYLTDTVTSTTSLTGRPMTSPDSRHMVTVDEFTGKVTVASVSDEGLMETTYEVTVSASISDVTFLPASTHHGYDLVLTSADDDDIIMMNLVTGKVGKIAGSRYSSISSSWAATLHHRHVVSGDNMSHFVMAPSKSSLAIVDVKFKQVECEFLDTVSSEYMLHIPSTITS